MFGISVVFNERGYWSKRYTYLHPEKLERDTKVVVQNQHFYTVAKVVNCVENFTPDPAIVYRTISKVLDI